MVAIVHRYLDFPAMAKKKTKRDPKPGMKRYRRTDDELIDDLKAQIEALKQRKAARELKESPAAKQAIQAYRAVT